MPPSKNISFQELSKHFHLPINQVAKDLGVCATILKKICRKNGIPRWPYRKIKSLDKMIANLEMNLSSKAIQEQGDIKKEIALLQAKRTEIMNNPDVLTKGQGLDFVLSRPSSVKMKASKTTMPKPNPPSKPLTTNSPQKDGEILSSTTNIVRDERLNCFANPSSHSSLGSGIPTFNDPALNGKITPAEVESLLALKLVAMQNNQFREESPSPFMFSKKLPLPTRSVVVSPAPSFDFNPDLPHFQKVQSTDSYKLQPLEPSMVSAPPKPAFTKSSVNDLLNPTPSESSFLPDWFFQEKERVSKQNLF